VNLPVRAEKDGKWEKKKKRGEKNKSAVSV